MLSSAIEEQTTIIRDTPEKREEDGVGWIVRGGAKRKKMTLKKKEHKWISGNYAK